MSLDGDIVVAYFTLPTWLVCFAHRKKAFVPKCCWMQRVSGNNSSPVDDGAEHSATVARGGTTQDLGSRSWLT